MHHLDASETAYYALLHLWLAVGPGLESLRLLSAIFAIAAVPLVFALANRLFGTRTAFIAALLVSVNVYFVQHAQAVSPYGIVLFLAAGAMLCFERLLARPTAKNVALLVGFAVTLVYIHAMGILLLIALGASLVTRADRSNTPWRQLTIATLLIIVIIAPLVFFATHAGPNRLAWITRPRRLMEMVAVPLLAFAGTKIFAYLCAAAIVVALVDAVRARSWTGAAVALTWLVVPIAMLFAESEVGEPLFLSRYVIYAVIPFLMLVARGIATIRSAFVVAAVTVGMLALSVLALRIHYQTQITDYRGAAGYVGERLQQGDGVVVYDDDCATTYQLAVTQARAVPERLIYPSSSCRFWLDRPPIVGSEVDAWSTRYSRIWFVMRGYATKVALRETVEGQLARRYRKAGVANFQLISVARFDRIR